MVNEFCYFCGVKPTYVGLNAEGTPLHFVCDKHQANRVPGDSAETHRRPVNEAGQHHDLKPGEDIYQEGDEISFPGQDWAPIESGFGGPVSGGDVKSRRPIFTPRVWSNLRGQVKQLQGEVERLNKDHMATQSVLTNTLNKLGATEKAWLMGEHVAATTLDEQKNS